MVSRELEDGEMMSWAGYFASQAIGRYITPSITGLFPLFEEKAATFPMMKHGLMVICAAIKKTLRAYSSSKQINHFLQSLSKFNGKIPSTMKTM